MSDTVFYELEHLANAACVFTYSAGIPGSFPSQQFPGMTHYSSDGLPIITGRKVAFNFYQIVQMFGHQPKHWETYAFRFDYLKKITIAYVSKDEKWKDMLDSPPFEYVKSI